MGIKVLAKEGDNQIDVALNAPWSNGNIYLGEGASTLTIDAKQLASSMIMGFRENPDTKIVIKNADEKDFHLIDADPAYESIVRYDLVVDGKRMGKLHNTYTTFEREVVARAEMSLQKGEGLIEELDIIGLSLGKAPDLVKEDLAGDLIVFE